MKAINRLQQGTERRELRFAEFQAFFDGAESLFSALIKRDYGVSPPIKITIMPGGRMGGQDKRLIEIFFSLVDYDSIAYEDRGIAKDASFEGSRTLREQGPCLIYQRADTGDVYCILQPATTDESKIAEDMVILGIVRKPCRLNALAHSHWRDLLAYRECTSINGSPSCLQKLRCAHLRHFKRYGKDRKCQPAKAPKWMGQLLTITASFALGGLITTSIEKRLFPDAVQAPSAASRLARQASITNCQRTVPPKSNSLPTAGGKKPAAP